MKPAPKITHSQVMCVLAEAGGALVMIILMSYTSQGLLSMSKDEMFNITEEQGSWIGAIVPGMALLGSLVSGQTIEKYGRRYVALMTLLPTVFSWICIAFATSANQVIAARLIAGAALGINKVAVSVYISETVNPALRPKFGIIPGVTVLGGLFVYNFMASLTNWRGMALLGALYSIPALILFWFLPETPKFLLKSDKPEDSLKTLEWLKQDKIEAEKEYRDLEKVLLSSGEKQTDNVTFSDLLKPPYKWPFCIALLLHVFQQTAGIGVVISFMGIILVRAGSAMSPGTSSLLLTILNIGCMFLNAKIMPKYSRKSILTASSVMIIAASLGLSLHFWSREATNLADDESLSFVPGICVLFYSIGFSIGWGPLPWMFIGDGLPSKVRGIGAGLVAAVNWGFNFLVTKSYSWLIIYVGNSVVFLVYALFTIVGMNVMLKHLPETFGFREIQLEKYYKDSYKKNI